MSDHPSPFMLSSKFELKYPFVEDVDFKTLQLAGMHGRRGVFAHARAQHRPVLPLAPWQTHF